MFFKKKEKHLSFDRSRQIPVIRSSICTGEKDPPDSRTWIQENLKTFAVSAATEIWKSL